MLGQNGVSRGRGNALVPLPQEVLNGPTSRRVVSRQVVEIDRKDP
jgi:hypothetical protein